MTDFDQLLWQLEHEDESQAIAAAHALGDLGDPRAFAVLVRLLHATSSAAVRNATAIGLRELGDPAAVPELLREIRDPEHATNRGTLLYALETLDARGAVVDLAHVLCGGSYEGMAMALHVMQAFHGPLDPGQKAQALRILRLCPLRDVGEEWQRAMLSEAIEILDHIATQESGA